MVTSFEISVKGVQTLVPFWKMLDMRRTYVLMLDTETLTDSTCKDISENAIVYDCGISLIDTTTETVYFQRSWVVRETFTYEFFAEMRKTAYYAKKFPKYWVDIWEGKRTVASFWDIRREITSILKTSGCAVCAHNARFDVRALNNTVRLLSCGVCRWFFPYGTVIWDTLKMARDVLSHSPSYIRFCEENGYSTKSGKPRFTAEILYRYISKDNDFTESHTGLEDVLIETDILRYLIKQHKPMRKGLRQSTFSGIPASFLPFDENADYCQP